MIDTEMRSGELAGLVDLLRKQDDIKVDEVVSASRLVMVGGQLHIRGGASRLDLDGVTPADAVLDVTDVFDGGVSDKLGIPRQYLRRLRDSGQTVIQPFDGGVHLESVSLYDANVNGWLQAEPNRKFLVRTFRTENPEDVGIARALLSDSFARYDNLDVLLAVLAGVRDAGVEVEVHRASLTERQMRVMLTCPAITALSPRLLDGYRSPFDGRSGRDLPVVWAGLDIRNSETGGGAFSVAPAMLVEVCKNGMTRMKDAVRRTHLGAKMDEGVVRWSADTTQKNVELVKAQARDAVSAFLNADYLNLWVQGVEQQAAVPLADAAGTLERVAKVHAFTEQEAASILACFVKSGDLTAGGVMQAVTAAAQGVDSADRQAEMEDAALDVLATAAAG